MYYLGEDGPRSLRWAQVRARRMGMSAHTGRGLSQTMEKAKLTHYLPSGSLGGVDEREWATSNDVGGAVSQGETNSRDTG